MSNQYKRKLSLAGIDPSGYSREELHALVRKLLEDKIFGLSFSPYVAGQSPGAKISEAQIRERLAIIENHVHWIRTFSCTDGHELIPAIAAEKGIKCMVGAWIEGDREKNDIEIANAIEIAKAGHAAIVAVGNEVLLRGELTENEIIDYIRHVKAHVPAGVQVGYVDAYFEFSDHPALTAECDVVLANCYPFWEGCPAEHSLLYMKDMYRRAQYAANGKPVIVSETGWPNVGSPEQGAVPSHDNAIRYLLNTYRWAEEDGVDVIYFSSFDEAWKVGAEGDVGAYWGLWDADGNPKYW